MLVRPDINGNPQPRPTPTLTPRAWLIDPDAILPTARSSAAGPIANGRDHFTWGTTMGRRAAPAASGPQSRGEHA